MANYDEQIIQVPVVVASKDWHMNVTRRLLNHYAEILSVLREDASLQFYELETGFGLLLTKANVAGLRVGGFLFFCLYRGDSACLPQLAYELSIKN